MTEEQKKRNRVSPGQVRLLVMMPESLVQRLDLYAEWLGEKQRGIKFTRSDSIRALLIGALESHAGFNEWLEQRHGAALAATAATLNASMDAVSKPSTSKPPAAKPAAGKPS